MRAVPAPPLTRARPRFLVFMSVAVLPSLMAESARFSLVGQQVSMAPAQQRAQMTLNAPPINCLR